MVFGFAFKVGVFDSYFAIVRSGKVTGAVDPIDGAVSGDDGERVICGREFGGETIGSELLAGGTVNPFEEGPVPDAVGNLAAAVWGGDHNDPDGDARGVFAEPLAEDDPAKRVGYEADSGWFFGEDFLDGGVQVFAGEGFDGFFAGGVGKIRYGESLFG